jgi:pSer/pThr/pTyr-binding forkhead associated (FHA) protein
MGERMDGVRVTWTPGPLAKGGGSGSATFPIGSIVTIGRSADNNIVLPDERVSRAHARLQVRDGETWFTDLNSTNGSVIDGRNRLGTSIWRDGQKLEIGYHVLELQFVHAAPMTVVRPLVENPITTVRPLVEAPTPTPASAQSDAPTRMELRPRSTPTPSAAPSAAPAAGLRKLEIVLNSGSIADVPTSAYAVGVFEHINPTGTRGAALALDEKLGGLLGTMTQGNAFDCDVGEVSILRMPSQDRSLTALLVIAGMGAINAFAPPVLEIVGEKLAKVLSAAKILEFATVPMGVGTGLSIKDFVVRFLTGFLRGLTDAKDSEPVQKVSISEVDKEKSEAIRREIKALIAEGYFTKLGYQVSVSETDNRVRGGESALPAAPLTTPVYLQVLRKSDTNLEYCLLSAELGAAIQLYEHSVDPGEQTRLADMAARLREFDAKIGDSLANTYVPAPLQELISRSLQKATAHLVVIHDQQSSTIPWEAFYFKDRCPALELGVSRLYRIANRDRVAGQPILPPDATLRMLVVENPTGDLAGAQNEGEQLTELFRANRGEVVTLKGTDASRANVLTELGSGTYDLLHYAGHADFVELKPEESGLILKDGRLTAADLLEVGKVPQMIFLNACESGRRELPAQRHCQLHRHVLAGERCRRPQVRRHLLRRPAVGQVAELSHARSETGDQDRQPEGLGQLHPLRRSPLQGAARLIYLRARWPKRTAWASLSVARL